MRIGRGSNIREKQKGSIPLLCDTLILESKEVLVESAECLKYIIGFLLFGCISHTKEQN